MKKKLEFVKRLIVVVFLFLFGICLGVAYAFDVTDKNDNVSNQKNEEDVKIMVEKEIRVLADKRKTRIGQWDKKPKIVNFGGYTYYEWKEGGLGGAYFGAPTPDTIKKCLKEVLKEQNIRESK